MDMLNKLNAALNYIEDNLSGDIDIEKAAQKAETSMYNFQRMFSFMADIPLSEYIRRRRLTLAALELQSGAKVIDAAMKYGYDSPISFARAFGAIHGLSPSEAKKSGVKLTLYPRISFQITVKGVSSMKYRIEEKSALKLVGVKKRFTSENDRNLTEIPQMWVDVNENGMSKKLMSISSSGNCYGLCGNYEGSNFDYIIAVQSDKEPIEGTEKIDVKANTYAVFEHTGPISKSFQKLWKQIFTEWFPSSGYERGEGYEFEMYTCGDTESDGYYAEIWIPIKKC